MPHHVYLDDGRLLTWFHASSTDEVSGFQVTFNADVGTKPIPLDEGLALLATSRRRRDGRQRF